MTKHTEVTEITRAQYLQLVGLLTLAQRHYVTLREIERAACEITGEEFNEGGHTGDEIYTDGPPDADDLLRRLGIAVREEGVTEG
jgi:hypothetical protein